MNAETITNIIITYSPVVVAIVSVITACVTMVKATKNKTAKVLESQERLEAKVESYGMTARDNAELVAEVESLRQLNAKQAEANRLLVSEVAGIKESFKEASANVAGANAKYESFVNRSMEQSKEIDSLKELIAEQSRQIAALTSVKKVDEEKIKARRKEVAKRGY